MNILQQKENYKLGKQRYGTKSITFDEAKTYNLKCNPYREKKIGEMDLIDLDKFLGWIESQENISASLHDDMRHIARYLKEDHIASSLEAQLEEIDDN